MPKARAAVLKALELDESLADAHSALGLIQHVFDWDWFGAERAFKRALDLNPSHALTHRRYARLLVGLGRLEEASAAAQRSRELDPLTVTTAGAGLGLLYQLQGNHALAIAEFEADRDLELNSYLPRLRLGYAHCVVGAFAAGIAELEVARGLTPDEPQILAYLSYCQAKSGRADEARALVSEIEAMAQRGYVDPTSLVIAHIGLGNVDAALDWLDRASQVRAVLFTDITFEPVFDPLRGEPRFQDLLRRMNLPM